VDGEKVGETPLLLENVEQRVHRLDLVNEDLQIRLQFEVDIPPEGCGEAFHKFFGALHLSTPTGSQVLLDGLEVHFDTSADIALLPGFHTLRCVHPTRQKEQVVFVFVEPDRTTHVRVDF